MTPAESEHSKTDQPRLILMQLSGKHCFLAWKGFWPKHSHNTQASLHLFASHGSVWSNGSQDRKGNFLKEKPQLYSACKPFACVRWGGSLSCGAKYLRKLHPCHVQPLPMN